MVAVTESPAERQVIRLPALHQGQIDVVNSKARFKVLACGRRWGKTRLASALCIKCGLEGKVAWWVAPTYPLAAEGWRVIKRIAQQIPGVQIRETDRIVSFPATGGWIQIRSSVDEGSLRGTGLDFVVMEEYAFGRESAWTEEIRPALADKKGSAIFISTPDGLNHFWKLFRIGQDPDEPDWESWQKPTMTNPYIDPAEIEAARKDMPEDRFAQEFLAKFLSTGAGVFRHVEELSTMTPILRGVPGREYVVGMDWGRVSDFSVFSVWDLHARRQVYQDRFNQIDYTVQLSRFEATFARFRPILCIAEQNSIGAPLIELLHQKRYPVFPWVATVATKKVVIEAFQLALEQKTVRLLNDDVQKGELMAFQAKRLPSGLIRYSAPDGMHDDCVIANALANQATLLPRDQGTHLTFAGRPALSGSDD